MNRHAISGEEKRVAIQTLLSEGRLVPGAGKTSGLISTRAKSTICKMRSGQQTPAPGCELVKNHGSGRDSHIWTFDRWNLPSNRELVGVPGVDDDTVEAHGPLADGSRAVRSPGRIDGAAPEHARVVFLPQVKLHLFSKYSR